MEKKNTILLTVIAVATLLVAVVGATFAYFTASVTNSGTEGNNTTTVTTKAIASASFELGSSVEGEDVKDALPGYKALRSLKVVGGGDAGSSLAATITLTPNVPAAFGTHIKYTIYKAATEDAVTCTASNPTIDGEKYYDSMTCNPGTATVLKTATALTGTTASKVDVTVNSGTTDYYFIVVEYENVTDAQQDTEQAKEFSVAIDFSAKA